VIYIAGKGFTNKAVSQVIAALLLIAISVAAAVLFYVFSIGLLGSLGSMATQSTAQSPTTCNICGTVVAIHTVAVHTTTVTIHDIVQFTANGNFLAILFTLFWILVFYIGYKVGKRDRHIQSK
jgi:FlaG/FlaF family flagellin (archaellin)